MKKIILVVVIILTLWQTNCRAYTYDGVSIDISELEMYLNDKYDKIDTQEILDMLTLGDISGVAKKLFSYFVDNLKATLDYHKNIMYTIIGICIATLILKLISADEKFNGGIILTCALSIVLINLYLNIYKVAYETITDIFSILKISFPLFVGVSTAANKGILISESVFIFFISLFNFLCTKIFLPCVSVAVALSLSDFMGNMQFKKVSGTVLNCLNWIIGICATLFVCMLKITQAATYTTERVALNGVKYTLSKSIPVVGGYVSDSLGAIIGAAFIIKNSIGFFMAALLIFICLTPVVYIFVCSFLIKLLSFVFDMFSDGNTSRLLSDIGTCISEMAVILLSTVLSFVICISVMMSVMG